MQEIKKKGRPDQHSKGNIWVCIVNFKLTVSIGTELHWFLSLAQGFTSSYAPDIYVSLIPFTLSLSLSLLLMMKIFSQTIQSYSDLILSRWINRTGFCTVPPTDHFQFPIHMRVTQSLFSSLSNAWRIRRLHDVAAGQAIRRYNYRPTVASLS